MNKTDKMLLKLTNRIALATMFSVVFMSTLMVLFSAPFSILIGVALFFTAAAFLYLISGRLQTVEREVS